MGAEAVFAPSESLMRQTAREDEMDALQQAKSMLSGAKVQVSASASITIMHQLGSDLVPRLEEVLIPSCRQKAILHETVQRRVQGCASHGTDASVCLWLAQVDSSLVIPKSGRNECTGTTSWTQRGRQNRQEANDSTLSALPGTMA